MTPREPRTTTLPGDGAPEGEATPRRGAPPSSAAIEPGSLLGERYLVIEVLGGGGFGTVYRVQDQKLQREVALKLLHGWGGTAEDTERLLSEARAAARLDHPNVVPVHDAGVLDGKPFITMGLQRGRSLDDVLEAETRLEPRRAARILEQLCAALDHAHAQGVLHRDVKPANVVLDERDQLRLLDFGISRVADAKPKEGERTVSGTLGYIAPELLRGAAAGPRSDVFAAGVTLYRMLVGRTPFRTTSVRHYASDVLEHADQAFEELPDEVPQALRRVLRKALAPAPEERHATGAELARDVRRAVGRPSRRRVLALAATVLAVVGLASAGAWFFRPLEVTAQLRAVTTTADGRQVEMVVDETTLLHEGDGFWLDRVSVNRAAHLHVLLLASDGSFVPLPGAPVEAVLPGREIMIPAEEAWRLDDQPGMETVVLVATAEPLPADGVRALVEEVRDATTVELDIRARGVTGVLRRPLDRAEAERRLLEILTARFPAVHAFRMPHGATDGAGGS